MKVARLSHHEPAIGSLSSVFGGGTVGGSSGQVPTSNGSNVAWGSNIATVFANGSNQVIGPSLNLAAGSNIIFTYDGGTGSQASNTIRIHSTATGGGGGGSGAITSNGSNSLSVGTVNLQAGTGVALGVAASTITITNTGAGGGGGSSTADAVRNQIGNGEIVIPALAADSRIRVAGANDMEFDSTTIGGTALGSPTTIDANTTVKSALYIKKSAAAGFSLQGRYWTPPATPFTATCHISHSTIPRADFMRVGFGIAEATPGKTEGIYMEHNSGRYISTISSTTPTTGAAYVTQGTGTAFQVDPPIWFRVIATSSTDVTWQYSKDGFIFTTFGTASRNPGFTIGSVYVSAHPEQATHDVACGVDYIRFT